MEFILLMTLSDSLESNGIVYVCILCTEYKAYILEFKWCMWLKIKKLDVFKCDVTC